MAKMTAAENLHTELSRLAKECDSYDNFREKALARTPDIFKPSIGPHLLEWYVEFRYPDKDEKAEQKKLLGGHS
jgi:hypothetical protein